MNRQENDAAGARWMPLNRSCGFETWAPLDPGRWIDFNPCCVQLPSGRWLGVIRRDIVPPVPGMGTVWTIELDEHLCPAGEPCLLLAQGEDPRAIVLGGRVLVFHCVIERAGDGRVNGAAMRIAECAIEDTAGAAPMLRVDRLLELPKNPLQKPRTGDPHENWEKNWVPFPLPSGSIGLIYSHDPWAVLLLKADAASESRHFEGGYQGPGLEWAWGEIRGGTVPVPAPAACGGERLITFYHSSMVVGSRKLYFVGACVFDAEPPFWPRLMTHEPLVVAPYNTGAHRFGWNFAGSVVFPLGAQPVAGGFRLLCGRDDGSIATFMVDGEALLSRLAPLCEARAVHNARGESISARHEPLVPWAFDASALRIPRLLALMHDGRGLFVDAAPGDGVATARLAAHFERSIVFAANGDEHRRMRQLLALNGIDTAELRLGEAVFDEPAMRELGLLYIDRAALAEAILRRAVGVLKKYRPLLVIDLPDDEQGVRRIEALLAECDYTCEAIFPFVPSCRLAIPRESRANHAWLV